MTVDHAINWLSEQSLPFLAADPDLFLLCVPLKKVSSFQAVFVKCMIV